MAKPPVNAAQKQVGRFSKGQSGNPAGKPKGARHKSTLAAMALLEGEAEQLSRKAVELALAGDTTALKLCLDRVAPLYKVTSRPVFVAVAENANLATIARAYLDAASQGDIPPDTATHMITAIANVARVEEIETLKDRLEALERALKSCK